MKLANFIESASAGRLQIKIYAAGELIPAFEVFDAVSRGTAEMGHGAAYYWKGQSEAAQFFTAIPFGMTAQEMISSSQQLIVRRPTWISSRRWRSDDSKRSSQPL